MRLFVGLDLPSNVQDQLATLIESIRPAAKLRWSVASNLHITTKFIGELPEPQLEALKSRLAALIAAPMEIGVRGLGWFPNPHNPKVFFAAVRAPEALHQLASITDAAVAGLGIERETRKYSPHLTLARIQPGTDLRELRRRVAALPSDDFGSFAATAFHLYLSTPTGSGSVYTKLASFRLQES
ncbi:MAG: RNA 2',3'-cyclic phosphodiesterase [Acidobacteria bacterium]|nr:RNA 2',3'-cyclic phosphodiesterase [Acidobacteriota bacterium]